jgi:vancomycin permeability regulator SanA
MKHTDKGFIGLGIVIILALALLPVIVLVTSFVIVQSNRQFFRNDPTEVAAVLEAPGTAVVYGSGLRPEDGTPRPVLAARLDAAIELYEADAIGNMLVTGATDEYYHEPRAMEMYLVTRGVPEEAVVQDPQGESTFESCQRAVDDFGITQAVLVTQSSHLARAIYLCRSQGMEAFGYPAEAPSSRAAQFFQFVRETGGNVRAIFDVVTDGSNRPE